MGQPQCDHQLLVTGAKRLHYVSYNPNFPRGKELALVVYRRNQESLDALLEAELTFMDMVRRQIPPWEYELPSRQAA